MSALFVDAHEHYLLENFLAYFSYGQIGWIPTLVKIEFRLLSQQLQFDSIAIVVDKKYHSLFLTVLQYLSCHLPSNNFRSVHQTQHDESTLICRLPTIQTYEKDAVQSLRMVRQLRVARDFLTAEQALVHVHRIWTSTNKLSANEDFVKLFQMRYEQELGITNYLSEHFCTAADAFTRAARIQECDTSETLRRGALRELTALALFHQSLEPNFDYLSEQAQKYALKPDEIEYSKILQLQGQCLNLPDSSISHRLVYYAEQLIKVLDYTW